MNDLTKQSPTVLYYIAAFYTLSRAIQTILAPKFTNIKYLSPAIQHTIFDELKFSYISISILIPLITTFLYKLANTTTKILKWTQWSILIIHAVASAWVFWHALNPSNIESHIRSIDMIYASMLLLTINYIVSITILLKI